MSPVPDLATMQLLLRQGRWPASLSLGLLLAALLLLGVEPGLAMIAAGLLLLSIAAGIAQAYHAWRVGLDAGLLHFDDLAREAVQDFRIDAVVRVAHQRFAGEFQQDALELDRGGHACVPGGQNGRIVAAKERPRRCAAFETS